MPMKKLHFYELHLNSYNKTYITILQKQKFKGLLKFKRFSWSKCKKKFDQEHLAIWSYTTVLCSFFLLILMLSVKLCSNAMQEHWYNVIHNRKNPITSFKDTSFKLTKPTASCWSKI